MTPVRTCALAVLLVPALAGPAQAGPGDLHEITAELANLRASPSDAASVRDRLEGGTEVIELRRDGGWFGVRVVDTGQEGWVWGEHLQQGAAAARRHLDGRLALVDGVAEGDQLAR